MKCADCGGEWGVYAPPCPAAPGGAISHHCYAIGRFVVEYPTTDEQAAIVASSVATSKANAKGMRR